MRSFSTVLAAIGTKRARPFLLRFTVMTPGIKIDVAVIKPQGLVDPQPCNGDQAEQGRARPAAQVVSRSKPFGTPDDRGDFAVRVDIWPSPPWLARDQPGRRHLGSRIVALQPFGKNTHHAKASRPCIVVGLAERRLPAQEQIDRDVIGAFSISKGSEAAQYPRRE